MIISLARSDGICNLLACEDSDDDITAIFVARSCTRRPSTLHRPLLQASQARKNLYYDSHSMNPFHRFSQLQLQRQSREELQRSSSSSRLPKKNGRCTHGNPTPETSKVRTVDDRQIRRPSLPSVQSSLRLDLTSSPPLSSHALLAGHN